MNRTILGSLLLGLNLCFSASVLANIPPLDLRFSEQLNVQPMTSFIEPGSMTGLHLRMTTEVRSSLIHEVVLSEGKSLLGTDYVLGADGDEAVDCSSLVQRMYRSVGLDLPRTAREQASVGTAVKAAEVEPGDLLFYRWGKRGLHVAVYLPGDRILHASTSRREVVVTALNKTWKKRLVSARRPL